jgi:DNA-binding CsgD family transcriptional regulator
MLDTSPIVDKLYEAVLDLDLWPSAIEGMADALGSAGSALLSNTRAGGLWVRVDPAARALFEQRFMSRNPMHAYVTRARATPGYRPSVISDGDVAALIDIRRTDYFHEFLEPFDGPSALAFDLGLNSDGMTAALNLSRTARQGAFADEQIEAARSLHAHLRRAFWLSVKLSENARIGQGMLALFERSDFCIFLLDHEGRISYANKVGDALVRARNGLRCEGRVLCALRSDAAAKLQNLIANAVSPEPGIRTGGQCSLPRPMRLPLTATVTPLRADRPALFEANPSAIVCVFDPTSPMTFSPTHLREMFGLSAAEARVAMKLLEGLDQKEIAQALGISFFTVRAHLSQIFQKTHTNRQSEFVALAMRSVSPALFGYTQ